MDSGGGATVPILTITFVAGVASQETTEGQARYYSGRSGGH